MKTFLLAILLTLSTIGVMASTVSGTISDKKTGELLVGVKITLEGQTTYTNMEGKFTFEDIPEGQYKIKASIISYKPATFIINVGQRELHWLPLFTSRALE